jgi:hypothetical protein
MEDDWEEMEDDHKQIKLKTTSKEKWKTTSKNKMRDEHGHLFTVSFDVSPVIILCFLSLPCARATNDSSSSTC